MLWENTIEESYDVCECTSLISTSFTLNSGGRSASNRISDARLRQPQRRLNIAPLRINYDESCSSPEKENMSTEDMSFYAGNSPQASPRPCSISPCMDLGMLSPETSPSRFIVVRENTSETINERRTLDEHDGSSMDSGYGVSFVQDGTNGSKNNFKFIAPCGVAPRRTEPSPRKLSLQTSPKSSQSFKLYHSLSSGSMESIDDEYMELFELESLDDDTHLPSNLNNLISGDIKVTRTTPENKRPLVRRSLSLNSSSNSNNNDSYNVRSALFVTKTPEILKSITENLTPNASRIEGGRCFKRPEPPSDGGPTQIKRYKTDNITDDKIMEKENDDTDKENDVNLTDIIRRPLLRKSVSMNDAVIMNALARSSSDPDLIGDFSKSYCLPLMDGRHSDLKSISTHTMAKLVRGEFNSSVASFKVIDCRYPYEYEGGHIKGAKNFYQQEQIIEELVNLKTEEEATIEENGVPLKRHILVFHCEFSSERGPKLSRFLRNHDRSNHKNAYPALDYPEIYLLNGGYKDFFENYSDLCDPNEYRPMLHPSYSDAYKHFRAKSKSWTGDFKSTTSKSTKSRSRLVW